MEEEAHIFYSISSSIYLQVFTYKSFWYILLYFTVTVEEEAHIFYSISSSISEQQFVPMQRSADDLFSSLLPLQRCKYKYKIYIQLQIQMNTQMPKKRLLDNKNSNMCRCNAVPTISFSPCFHYKDVSTNTNKNM